MGLIEVTFKDKYQFVATLPMLAQRLEELYDVSKTFIATKDTTLLTAIIRNIVTDNFEKRYRIDYHYDVQPRGTRLHDLLNLTKIWIQIRSFVRLGGDDGPDISLGEAVMADLVRQTEKLLVHPYDELGY